MGNSLFGNKIQEEIIEEEKKPYIQDREKEIQKIIFENPLDDQKIEEISKNDFIDCFTFKLINYLDLMKLNHSIDIIIDDNEFFKKSVIFYNLIKDKNTEENIQSLIEKIDETMKTIVLKNQNKHYYNVKTNFNILTELNNFSSSLKKDLLKFKKEEEKKTEEDLLEEQLKQEELKLKQEELKLNSELKKLEQKEKIIRLTKKNEIGKKTLEEKKKNLEEKINEDLEKEKLIQEEEKIKSKLRQEEEKIKSELQKLEQEEKILDLIKKVEEKEIFLDKKRKLNDQKI